MISPGGFSMEHVHGNAAAGGTVTLHAYSAASAGFFYPEQQVRSADVTGQLHSHWIGDQYNSIHAGAGGYLSGAEALVPQYEGESWSAKNARLLALRKERSRDAARSRRGKENYEFYELAKLLPLPAAITSQLDKASIIRLSISYLRMRDFCLQGDPPWHPSYYANNSQGTRRTAHSEQGLPSHTDIHIMAKELYDNNLGTHILQAYDGFLFTLCSDGRFLYISETVSIYLGLSQVELTGSSMFDFVHPGDHMELAEVLGMKLTADHAEQAKKEESNSDGSSPMVPSPPATPQDNLSMSVGSRTEALEKSLLIRMKSTLTKRGVNFKSSGYKVIYITGSLRPRYLPNYETHVPEILGFVGVAFALPPPTFNELRLEPTCFVCKVNMDFKITYCEERINSFLDYANDEVTGQNLYHFLHAQDVKAMRHCHLDMLTKGQSISSYFRWMCKSGGYVWMQATILLLLAKNSSDTSFIFIFQVISSVEHASVVMNMSQMSSHLKNTKCVEFSLSPEAGLSQDVEPDNKKPSVSEPDPPELRESEGSRLQKRRIQDAEQRRFKKKKPRKVILKDIPNGHAVIKHNIGGEESVLLTGRLVKSDDEHSSLPKLKSIGNSKKAAKLQTFDYQNNNVHSPDTVLKVPIIEKIMDRRSSEPYGGIHSQHEQTGSVPSSPISAKSGYLSDHSPDSMSPLREMPLSRHQNPVYPPNMDISKVKEDQAFSVAMATDSSSVFHFSPSGRASSVHPDSREEFLYGPTPFMINSSPNQYQAMAFPNFAKLSSIQQYRSSANLASRAYHASPHGSPLLLKGYQNAHDIPMDLSYATHPSLAGYTPVPIMHTGLSSSSPSPYSANAYSPSHRIQFVNEELLDRVSLEKNLIPHSTKS